jgi:hypothetical protein
MDKIFRAEANKRHGQASCPPSARTLRSTPSSIPTAHSAPDAQTSDGSAALTMRPPTPTVEAGSGAVNRSISSADPLEPVP